jgi:uridylate kinase
MQASKAPYKRVLLKMSGEALMGDLSFGIDPKVLDAIVLDVKKVVDLGVQLGIVIGGGNLCRGVTLNALGLGRIAGDQMGMLATVMNAIAFRDACHRVEITAQIMSALQMNGVAKPFDRLSALENMAAGCVMIFAAGTGNPLVTTDSAASLRAIETESDILLKATHVDGVYSADPAHHKDAVLYKRVTFQEALDKELGIMDLTAFCQCRDQKMPIRVFNLHKPGALMAVIMGQDEGTLITE